MPRGGGGNIPGGGIIPGIGIIGGRGPRRNPERGGRNSEFYDHYIVGMFFNLVVPSYSVPLALTSSCSRV